MVRSEQGDVLLGARELDGRYTHWNGRGRTDVLFSWGLSFRSVFEPTRIPSCMVRILPCKDGALNYHSPNTQTRADVPPMGHDHALLPAKKNLLPSDTRDASIERLRISEGDVRPRGARSSLFISSRIYSFQELRGIRVFHSAPMEG